MPKEKILIIDDDEEECRILESHFGRMGYKVIYTPRLEEAEDYLEKGLAQGQPIEVMMLNHFLYERTTKPFLERVRRKYSSTEPILSLEKEDEIPRKSLDDIYGIEDPILCLEKPYTYSANSRLYDALIIALNKREERLSQNVREIYSEEIQNA